MCAIRLEGVTKGMSAVMELQDFFVLHTVYETRDQNSSTLCHRDDNIYLKSGGDLENKRSIFSICLLQCG